MRVFRNIPDKEHQTMVGAGTVVAPYSPVVNSVYVQLCVTGSNAIREGVGYVTTQLSCILLYYADDDMFRPLWAIFMSQKYI